MARIVVAGSGICGTAAALMLARDGHEVTVVERDVAPPPADIDEAWVDWDRRSIGQLRLAHLMLARGTRVLKAELPDVVESFVAAGALQWNIVKSVLGMTGTGAVEADDDRFDMVTGRRTSIEWALASAMAGEPRLTVRRGAAIAGLVAGTPVVPGVPHVTGVRLESGETVPADLVIDSTGRRSPTMRWLEALGGPLPDEQSEDSGFAYYGRFFRSADGSVPAMIAPGLTPMGSWSVLTIPSDRGTWSVTLYAASDDAALRRFRDPDVFAKVVRACPLHAHWLDGEPISEMASMTGVVDRSRTFVRDGVPVVTGMLSVADAWACTNPSLGRGMSIGLLHVSLMRRVVAAHLDDPLKLALEFHTATEAEVEPWHTATREIDRARNAEMRALVRGEEPPPSPVRDLMGRLGSIVPVDAVALRAFAELQGCLATGSDVFGRPGFVDHVMATAAEKALPPPPGPDRAQLLELVS